MSDKPRSTKPSSKMPSISSKPAFKMPKSEDEDAILPSAMFKDMSIAPQKSKVSSSSRAPAKEQDKKAKSTFAPIPEDDVLDEEYDDFEELTTPKSNYPELISPSKKPQSRVLSSSKYYDAKSNLTEKAKSVMPSAMFKMSRQRPRSSRTRQKLSLCCSLRTSRTSRKLRKEGLSCNRHTSKTNRRFQRPCLSYPVQYFRISPLSYPRASW